jgi:hypothetical protein
VKLDLVFRRSDIDWLNFPIKAWSISSHDIDHIQSGEGKAAESPRRPFSSSVLGSSIRVAVSNPTRLPVMRHDERDALQKS